MVLKMINLTTTKSIRHF